MYKKRKLSKKKKYMIRSVGSINKEERVESLLIAIGMLIFSLAVTWLAVAKPFGDLWGLESEETLEMEEGDLEILPERTALGSSHGGVKELKQSQIMEIPLSGSEELQKQFVPNADGLTETSGEEPLIVIDPGHGGTDDGCVVSGVKEKEINLQIALLVKEKLEEKGMHTMLTREEDIYLSKEERTAFADQVKADVFVSIHQSTFEDAAICGIETWYDGTGTKQDNQRLAQLVHEQTIKSTGVTEWEPRGDAEYQEKLAEGIAQGIYLFFYPKTMYLTFDDGPSAECTDMVLNILRERNIKATFFLIGEYVEKYPETAKRIADEGHTIGIHCYRHDYDVLYQSVDSYLEDFQKAYDVIEAATGVKTRLFRFPGGSVNAYNKMVYEEIIKEMTDRGFIYYDWNANLGDAAGDPTPEELLMNAKETTLDRKKVIMLAHDRVYNTALCLDRLITQFPEYKMEVLSPEVEPIKFALP